jgi:hypothetical protein
MAVCGTFANFAGGPFFTGSKMKKTKQSSRQRQIKLNSRQLKRRRGKVTDLTAQGKNRAVVAATLGIGVNRLREDYALELDAGRQLAAEAEIEDVVLTPAEYHVLNAMKTAFASPWHNPTFGNDAWAGIDGRGARTIEDAFAGWKSRGGKWNTTGLSTKFDPVKAAEFGCIAQNYRDTIKR